MEPFGKYLKDALMAIAACLMSCLAIGEDDSLHHPYILILKPKIGKQGDDRGSLHAGNKTLTPLFEKPWLDWQTKMSVRLF
jgi:hypothetical protein